jgi:hypothetical protein
MITISLDYDGTYTLMPDYWLKFIREAPTNVKIYCITMRHESERNSMDPRLLDLVDVIFTGRKTKRRFVESLGIHVHIWIDDMPDFIVTDSL